MDYQINNLVIVFNSSYPKKIVDYEMIYGKVIYYMDDNTSYSSEQIIKIVSDGVKISSSFNKNLQSQSHINELVYNSIDYLRNVGVIKSENNSNKYDFINFLGILSVLLTLTILYVIFYNIIT